MTQACSRKPTTFLAVLIASRFRSDAAGRRAPCRRASSAHSPGCGATHLRSVAMRAARMRATNFPVAEECVGAPGTGKAMYQAFEEAWSLIAARYGRDHAAAESAPTPAWMWKRSSLPLSNMLLIKRLPLSLPLRRVGAVADAYAAAWPNPCRAAHLEASGQDCANHTKFIVVAPQPVATFIEGEELDEPAGNAACGFNQGLAAASRRRL